MTKRTRTILFLALGAIFFLLAPAMILYSQGYRFSWEERQFSKVGAFYLSIIPTRAEVLVNGKSIGKTARVLGTTLTKDFSPGTYSIRVQKAGYHSWEKLLEIFPKQVTEAKHIVLLPANPVFTVLQEEVQAIWFGPNKTEALLQKANPKNTWTLFFWDIQKNAEYPLYDSPRARDEILNIEWDLEPDSFLLEIVSQGQQKSFVQAIDRSLLQSQRTALEALEVSAKLRTPIASKLQHVQSTTGIVVPESALTFFADDQQVVWLDRTGTLWQQMSNDAQARRLNEEPFLIDPKTPSKILMVRNEFFIQKDKVLYKLNPQIKIFEEFFSPFYEMALSPDARKLALSTGKEIWLYFFEEEQEQPSRSKGEKLFLTRLSENIENLSWLDSYHLLFVRGDSMVISEIDNRDHLNMSELAKFASPNFFWQDQAKTLLVHTGNQILSSKKLLP